MVLDRFDAIHASAIFSAFSGLTSSRPFRAVSRAIAGPDVMAKGFHRGSAAIAAFTLRLARRRPPPPVDARWRRQSGSGRGYGNRSGRVAALLAGSSGAGVFPQPAAPDTRLQSLLRPTRGHQAFPD